MGNRSISLPVVAGTGLGVAVDASLLAAEKTLICGGAFTKGTVTVEFSQNGTNWAPLETFTKGGKAFRSAACMWMRARSQDVEGSPSVDVGAEESTVNSASLAVPPGDGVGASFNVAAFGSLTTFVVGGELGGNCAVTVEGSQDDVDYAPLASFGDPGGDTVIASVKFMRVRTTGYQAGVPYSPVVTLGTTLGGAGAGGGAVAENVSMPPSYASLWGAQTVHTINVRLGGSDEAGDGSVGNPYATLKRALLDVPMIIKSDVTYAIDLTGMGVVPIDDSIYLGGYLGDGYTRYDYANNWRAYGGSLNFQSEPIVLDTIDAGDVTGIVTDPDSTLKTYQTSKSWTPSAFKGAIALGPDGSFQAFAIADNTGSDLKICTRYNLSYPFQIVVPSAELQWAGGTYVPINLWNNKASIGFSCLKLTGRPNTWGAGVESYGGNEHIQFWACQLSAYRAGAFPYNADGLTQFYGTSLLGDGLQFCGWKGNFKNFYGCFFDDLQRDETGYHDPTFNEIFQACIINNCDPWGIGHGYNDCFAGGFSIYKCEILNAKSVAVQALNVDPSILKDVLINNAASHAVYARGPTYLDLADVAGSGNGGLGVKLTNGAQIYHRWGTDVTGAGGDYQVGSNPAAAGGGAGWAAFTGVGFENDLAAPDPQLCRMFTVLNP
jgi:hypothetical protein